MSESLVPSSTTWTLRLKHHKTTVLVFVDPLSSISTVKSSLIIALRDTCSEGTLNDRPIPTEVSQIRLAKPADLTDLTKGWVRLDGAEEEDGENENEGKGKGKEKAKVKEIKGVRKRDDDVIRSSGLRDSQAVAFEWTVEDEERDGQDWDVQVLTYDQVYGED